MTDLTAPQPTPRPVTFARHGVTWTDEFSWLRDDKWQEVMRDPSVLDADIRAYLEDENAFTEQVMAPTATTQATLFSEMRGRIKEDDDTVPSPDGPFEYFARFVEGGQYAVHCRQPRGGGEVAVLFDGNAESEEHEYFQLTGVMQNNAHDVFAYGLDTTGSEYYTVRFRDAATGAPLDDVLENTAGYVVWSSDDQTVFYVVLDEHHRPVAVMRHTMGTAASEDVEVFREDDQGYFVQVGLTQDRSLVVVGVGDHQTSGFLLVPADDVTATPRLVQAREEGVQYDVERHGDQLLIHTNADEAEDFKIVSAPLDTPGRAHWTDVVAHEAGTLINGSGVLANHLVRSETFGALPRIIVRDLTTGEEHDVSFDEEAYALGLSIGEEYDSTTIRFVYSSPTTPSQVWEYDVVTRERTKLKELEIPSGHDPADYVTRRIMATASDGEQVPVTILTRADFVADGSAPAMLYGYGSYGLSTPASFSANRLSLVDRGFAYAIAHVRGGKDCGYRWYRLGRREHKPNTFTDFIAAAEALVEHGYSSVGRIAAHGGSAGGLLMGAITNLRPDLWGAILAEVPFVDVLTTMLDDTLPLTPPEWPEWGNPILDPEAFANIRAYSPYDNVAEQDHPPMWIEGGLTDPRVTYWEPAKWTARLRSRTTNPEQLLCCKINMGAGHGGKTGRFRAIEELAEKYAFVLLAMGVAEHAEG